MNRLITTYLVITVLAAAKLAHAVEVVKIEPFKGTAFWLACDLTVTSITTPAYQGGGST